jgi:hypothetical protein
MLGKRMARALKRHVQESREKFRDASKLLGDARAEMTLRHRKGRSKLEQDQKLAWEAETKARAARLPKGLSGIWHRITGKYQQVRAQNELEAKARAFSVCADSTVRGSRRGGGLIH